MTDETSTPDTEPVTESDATGSATAADAAPAAESGAAAAAWSDVVARMSELGTAVSAWARAAGDDPRNKQHIEQVRAGVDEMVRQADATFSKVASSDFGQQVTQGAQQAGEAIGDAAGQVSQAAAPHVATALSGLADIFGRAAAKVDEAVSRDAAAAPAAEATPAPGQTANEPQPPAAPAVPSEPENEGDEPSH